MNTIDDTLDTIAKVLIRSFWVGVALLMVTSLLFVTGGAKWGYEFHKDLWFGLTRHEYDLIALCGLAFFKCLIFAGFLLPYIGIRLVLRGRSAAGEATA